MGYKTPHGLATWSCNHGQFADRKLELAGFGWHQGWNDRVNQSFNDEYEQNMANFIRDIRKDLGSPGLPFVIAETGMSGHEEKHPPPFHSCGPRQPWLSTRVPRQRRLRGDERFLSPPRAIAFRPGLSLEQQRRNVLPDRRRDEDKRCSLMQGKEVTAIRH